MQVADLLFEGLSQGEISRKLHMTGDDTKALEEALHS